MLTSKNAGDGIKMVNDKFSVPEYEGATASTVGTSGLVPPATAGQQESFLTGGGEYKPALTKISDSVASADSTTAASSKAVKTAHDEAKKATSAGFGDIMPTALSGSLAQYKTSINITAPSAVATASGLPPSDYYVEVIGEGAAYALQRASDYYSDKEFIRKLKAGVWQPWVPANFPRPQDATGDYGSWNNLHTVYPNTLYLPAGGTWAYLVMGFTSGGTNNAVDTGVEAGGTAVGVPGETGSRLIGFAWRIA